MDGWITERADRAQAQGPQVSGPSPLAFTYKEKHLQNRGTQYFTVALRRIDGIRIYVNLTPRPRRPLGLWEAAQYPFPLSSTTHGVLCIRVCEHVFSARGPPCFKMALRSRLRSVTGQMLPLNFSPSLLCFALGAASPCSSAVAPPEGAADQVLVQRRWPPLQRGASCLGNYFQADGMRK
ncbi:hypothetical protein EYF80_010526 [Liparis tanakae]|uniref:Uncharacterized protein n=1 Tax=Liparis tanakae TaxID=230148 RepID=A0A4Z2INB8_9TELE|nr:hypothetical protein EYF80_010526 [Liparis tanakae]